MTKFGLPVLLIVVLVSTYASERLIAQTGSGPSAVRFVGYVSDPDSQPLNDVIVTVESGDLRWSARSNQDGQFQLELPAGVHAFHLEKQGFKNAIVTGFQLKAGTTCDYKFAMEPGVCNDCDWIFEGDPDSLISFINSSPIKLATPSPQSAPNIGVNGYLSVDKARRGSLTQAAVVMDIPSGYHVNSNRPTQSFLIATQLKIEAPNGIRVGPVTYPRAQMKKFQFSPEALSVYEGRVVLRFNITVPANFAGGSAELKARLRYQSCNNEVCFPPQNKDVSIPITVAGANDPVKRINAEFFGGRSR